ncbi:hypothetical protein SAMN05444487_104143 [Marininema mesophilum]|uniref:Uncharacterized protein n=1 Tax=Marininema mesophilum TaxID=1048340 RepID=A0A1H2ULH0_9BACL|nr:hypothetical protein SAMN05444487_104143 [Marininema mesophilum]
MIQWLSIDNVVFLLITQGSMYYNYELVGLYLDLHRSAGIPFNLISTTFNFNK